MKLHSSMTLEEMVHNTMIAYWLRGKGISDSVWNKYATQISRFGYEIDAIINEWEAQIKEHL